MIECLINFAVLSDYLIYSFEQEGKLRVSGGPVEMACSLHEVEFGSEFPCEVLAVIERDVGVIVRVEDFEVIAIFPYVIPVEFLLEER